MRERRGDVGHKGKMAIVNTSSHAYQKILIINVPVFSNYIYV